MTTRCPTCGDNAHEIERFDLDDSDGLPVPHVRIRCVSGHYFMMLAAECG